MNSQPKSNLPKLTYSYLEMRERERERERERVREAFTKKKYIYYLIV